MSSAAELLLKRPSTRLLLAPLLALCAAAACRARDPRRELAVGDFETYWAIARSAGETHYLAPVVRCRIRTIGEGPLRSVQANATFRRKGEEGRDWGSAFQQLVVPRKPLNPGESLLVVLTSDTHYYTNGAPEGIFGHEQFKDASVELFLRVGASSWVSFGEATVERRIGARSVQDMVR